MRISDYELSERIGAGGMGEVWAAQNVHTKVRYAVKLLPVEVAQDKNFVARFFDEGRVMSELNHPSIVRVHHVGQDKETGRYYLVMDYVSGSEGKPQTFHDVLQGKPENRITEADARHWATQVAEALAHAHERGIVHRDIKPGNILIDQNGNARVTDFGLAKAVGEESLRAQIHASMDYSDGRSMSRQNTIAHPSQVETSFSSEPTLKTGGSRNRSSADSLLGTYDYMSPEQRGELPGVTVGPASDVYSFGVMLYRLLTGRRPAGMAESPSALVPGLSKTWDALVARCMKHQPAERFKNGTELLAALKASGKGVAHRSWFWLPGLLIVGVIGYLSYAAFQSQKPAPPVRIAADFPGALSSGVTAAPPSGIYERPPSVPAGNDLPLPPEITDRPIAVAPGNLSSGGTSVPPSGLVSLGIEQTSPPIVPSSKVSAVAQPSIIQTNTEQPCRTPQEDVPLTLDLGGGVKLELVWIPPGEFIMGSIVSEKGRSNVEGMRRSVAINQGFWMGKYEVTQAQWERVMGNNPSIFKEIGPNGPVENVSWNICQEFLKMLNQKAELKSQQIQARLPTEAEWEYACRAGTTMRFNTGDVDAALDVAGWYKTNSGGKTHEVGEKIANAWGLYDMHGNVSEWCQDVYVINDYAALPDQAGRSPEHIYRGGSWESNHGTSRSASRFGHTPAGASKTCGFRVVCSSPPSP